MIYEYAVLFEKHGGHGKEAELTLFQEMINDEGPPLFDKVATEARASLLHLVDDPFEWKTIGVRRVK